MQDPAAFAAQHTAHFGGAGALPLTQLLLVDSPEPTRLLVTLAACPRTVAEAADSNRAGSTPVHNRSEQSAPSQVTSEVSSEVESAECTASAPASAILRTCTEQPTAERAATDMRVPGGASAGVGPGRAGALPCQLMIERFDWRSTIPEVLELAAWDAENNRAGRAGVAEAPAGQACAAADGRDSGGAYGSQSRDNSTSEPDTGEQDPAAAALESSGQLESTSAECQSSQTSIHWEGPMLLRLATGTFAGSQLDLPRGRHLLRLSAGFGRACTVELRSCAPFRAGDAVQVGLPAVHHFENTMMRVPVLRKEVSESVEVGHDVATYLQMVVRCSCTHH